MSKPKKDKFYLVQEDILPEAIKKTIKVKEILKLGEVKTINEAVEKNGFKPFCVLQIQRLCISIL